jgi:sodium transport system permease protein
VSRESTPGTSAFGRLGRLARKELSECLRDKRTIVTLILMPLLLYPLLGVLFRTLLLNAAVEKDREDIIGFPMQFAQTPQNSSALLGHLDWGRTVIDWKNTPEKERKQGRLQPANEFKSAPKFKVVYVDDVETAVRTGAVDLGINLTSTDGPVDRALQLGKDVMVDLYYRDDLPRSRSLLLYIERLLTEDNAFQLSRELQHRGFRPEGKWYPLHARAHEVEPPPGPKVSLLPVLVPLILILMTITGAVYPAIDLTAGERERGTLEILVAAPIPRLSVLFAKYIAVVTVAILTALVNLTAMTVTLFATGIGKAVFESALSPLVLVEVLGLLLLFAAFFSAVLLAVTSFARSFKEAQAYLIPLMLLALAPGVMGLMPDLHIQSPLAVVPLLNVVLLSRDLLEGKPDLLPALIVVSTTLFYAIAAVALAARIFGTEAVLTSEQGSWAEMFRRADTPRRAPELAAGLLTLALMFPTSFVTGSILAAAIDPDHIALRLLATIVSSVVLFVGFPAIAAWFGRVDPVSGFRLHRAGVLAWMAALLLGVSLWPFAHELSVLLRGLQIATLSKEVLEKLHDQVAKLRTLPLWLPLLAMGIVPAIVEELFFRGYLFRALEARIHRPVPVIVTSAVLFAVFHLLFGEVIAVERVPPSFLMGLVLGWIAWRTGSVWPGMVLHATHNSLLTMMGYFEPWIVEQKWLPSVDGHLPAGLLVGAAVLAFLGLALSLAVKRRTEAAP